MTPVWREVPVPGEPGNKALHLFKDARTRFYWNQTFLEGGGRPFANSIAPDDRSDGATLSMRFKLDWFLNSDPYLDGGNPSNPRRYRLKWLRILNYLQGATAADIIDVLTDEAAGAVLCHYPVLILVGPVDPDDSLLRRLRAYVENGGSLVWAAGVARPEHSELIGAAVRPELRVGRAWRWGQEPFTHEPCRYAPCEGSLARDTTVLARAQNGDALVLRHSVGKGCVYTCLVPWLEGGHSPLAGVALRLFDTVIEPRQPVKVAGLPVEWLSSRTDDAVFVALANHDGAPWKGTVTLCATNTDLPRCTEVLTRWEVAPRRVASGFEVPLELPAYDVRVLQWMKNASRRPGSDR